MSYETSCSQQKASKSLTLLSGITTRFYSTMTAGIVPIGRDRPLGLLLRGACTWAIPTRSFHRQFLRYHVTKTLHRETTSSNARFLRVGPA